MRTLLRCERRRSMAAGCGERRRRRVASRVLGLETTREMRGRKN
jgi:hypothetical protein